jgi:predicted PolB exonuclease-like 3'-5' exonuclease
LVRKPYYFDTGVSGAETCIKGDAVTNDYLQNYDKSHKTHLQKRILKLDRGIKKLQKIIERTKVCAFQANHDVLTA